MKIKIISDYVIIVNFPCVIMLRNDNYIINYDELRHHPFLWWEGKKDIIKIEKIIMVFHNCI